MLGTHHGPSKEPFGKCFQHHSSPLSHLPKAKKHLAIEGFLRLASPSLGVLLHT